MDAPLNSVSEPVGTLDVALNHAARLLEKDPRLAVEQAGEILKAVPGHPHARLILGAARRLMEINSRIELEQPKHVRLRREYSFAAKHEGLHGLEPCFAHTVLHLRNL